MTLLLLIFTLFPYTTLFRSKNGFELGMHAILARTQIHRTDRQPFHNGLHLSQRQAITARWISVAESAGKIALVGKRSEERRVGKECRYRGGWEDRKKKQVDN